MPGVAPLGTVTVIVDVVCEEEIEVGLKVIAGQPDGAEACRLMDPPKPPVAEKEIWELPDLPCATESDEGDAERVKPGTWGPERALIRLAPFGLPQPVARS